MKYMTFNSSCSYAGLANLLALHGVDTDDRTIALSMKLPFLFAQEGEDYLAGPMLQTGAWFDLYLNPRGFHLAERTVPAGQAAELLAGQKAAMLGIRTEQGKHAVVYIGTEAGKLRFLNNKRADDPALEEFLLTAEELAARLDETVVIAALEPVPPQAVDLVERMRQSIPVLCANVEEICALCAAPQPVSALRARTNSLFRPLLLDGITMLGLIGETELADRLTALQRELLDALRQSPDQPVTLGDRLDTAGLRACAGAYIRRIEHEIKITEKELPL